MGVYSLKKNPKRAYLKTQPQANVNYYAQVCSRGLKYKESKERGV
jgi:hypothetical protein